MGFRTHPSAVDLRIAGEQHHARRSSCRTRAGRCSRWGPGVGPAVLYWGELVVFIARRLAARTLVEARRCDSPSGCCSASASRRSRGSCSRSPRPGCSSCAGASTGSRAQSRRALALQRRAGAARAVHGRSPSSRWCSRASATACCPRPTWASTGRARATAASRGSRTRPPASLEAPSDLLGADVGLSRAVLRVGEVDGVRAGALAALGVQRVEDRRPVAR